MRSVQAENAGKLSKILECKISDLTVGSEADQLASSDDQKVAAALLTSSSLIDKLGPIGEWNVIESLLKATLVPQLPISVLGELYSQLTIASWRQSKIDQAEIYNKKTEDIAKKSGDQCLLATALSSKANIHAWRGRTQQAIKTMRECYALEKYMEGRRLGAVFSNLGGILHESGDLTEGERWIRRSLAVFEEHGKAMNLSISHCHLAMIALKRGEWTQAESEARASIQMAKQDDYRRGIPMGKLLLGEAAARTGRSMDAVALVLEALEEFEKLGVAEGLNFEFAGRVHRFIGQLEQAEKFLRHGINIAQEFPVYLAALHAELAEVLRAKGNGTWQTEAEIAIALYDRTECHMMVARLKKQFALC